MAAMRNSSILLIAGEYRMNNEENKGTLPEDDVGRPDETTDIEDRINATLDKILDDDEDEFEIYRLITRIRKMKNQIMKLRTRKIVR